MSLKKFAPHLVLTTHKPTGLYAWLVCGLVAIVILVFPFFYNLATQILMGLCVFVLMYLAYVFRVYQPDSLHISSDTLNKNHHAYEIESVHYYFYAVLVWQLKNEDGQRATYRISRWHVTEKMWRELVVYARLRAAHTA